MLYFWGRVGESYVVQHSLQGSSLLCLIIYTILYTCTKQNILKESRYFCHQKKSIFTLGTRMKDKSSLVFPICVSCSLLFQLFFLKYFFFTSFPNFQKIHPPPPKKQTGWCLTPTLLLICSSCSRENDHPLLICSSLSTSQKT